MPTLQPANLGDLLKDTLKDLGEMKVTELASDLQEHVAMETLLNANNVKLDSGTSMQWNVMIRHNGNFRFVGLYEVDSTDVGEVMIQAELPWRHSTASYAFDERELAMNRNPRKIVDILKERRRECMVGMAEGMEGAFWGYPLSTDSKTPHGAAYHIVKNGTEGFNGGAQTGYSTVSNINPTTYGRWKNYTAPYTTISEDDLVRKTRAAMRKTMFKPAAGGGHPTFNTGDKWGLYTNYEVVSKLEELVKGQNENLGNDLASKDGDVLFRKSPVKWVPKLDADTTNPIYGINWGVFKTVILRGYWMRQVSIDITPGQHTVAQVHIDSSFNWLCRDRRRNFVVSNGTTTPSA